MTISTPKNGTLFVTAQDPVLADAGRLGFTVRPDGFALPFA
ncbi:hypothetical protein [Rhizomonospora bruguierae]|nr:hypothetical protein [Micromonospora sp. NBRC 107566]